MCSKTAPAGQHNRALRSIDRPLSAVETVLNFASAFSIMVIMILSASEVVGRYFFNRPIPGHLEIVEMVMVGTVFFGIAYTQRVDSHIGMELIASRLKGRTYHLVEGFTKLVSLLIYCVITIYSFKFALTAFTIGDTSPAIYWPTWPSKLCVPLGSFFLTIRFGIQIVQHMMQAVTGFELQRLK